MGCITQSKGKLSMSPFYNKIRVVGTMHFMNKGPSEGWPTFMEVPGPKALSSVKLSTKFGHCIERSYQ